MTIGNAGRDLLVHLALLPVLEFLMTSPRVVGRDSKSKQHGVKIAGTVLVLVSAIKIGWEITSKEQSLYDMMEVSPTASAGDLKKGYKAASLKVLACLHAAPNDFDQQYPDCAPQNCAGTPRQAPRRGWWR